MENKTKNILLVGGYGATGRILNNEIDNKAYKIFNLTRDRLFNIKNKPIQVRGKDSQKVFFEEISLIHEFDTVIYLAGVWRGKNNDIDNFNENYYPFEDFISTIGKKTNKIIFFSSSAVYGLNKTFTEEQIIEMTDSTYGNAKIMSENLLINFCKKNLQTYTILRPFHIVSPFERYLNGRSHVVTDFVHLALNSKDEFEAKFSNLLKEPYIPFTWGHDLVKVIKKLASMEELDNEIYNIGAKDAYNLIQLHNAISGSIQAKILDKEIKSKVVNHFKKSHKAFGNYSSTKFINMLDIFIKYKLEEYKNA